MLLYTAAAAALRPPPSSSAYHIVDRGGSDCYELVGPSRVRHASSMPSFSSLERQLAAARQRHRALAQQCNDIAETPARSAWCAAELHTLKKKKLRQKDRIDALVSVLRRQQEEAEACQLGSGHYGNVLLGRSARHGRVAIKCVPRDAADGQMAPAGHGSCPSQLAREAHVLRALSGAAGFPALHYHGQQVLLGHMSDVLVMELLGPSLDDLCWQARGGTCFSPSTVTLALPRTLT
jgi:hypothetical protein